ncbi:MAG: hypothetical protein ACXVQT_09765 [Actinomycetota bacterium]
MPVALPPPPTTPRRRRLWRLLLSGFAIVAGGLVIFVVLDKTILTNDLLDARFGSGRLAPFVAWENRAGRADAVDGTYRLTVKEPGTPVITVGRFVRTAYAVGVRAEFSEVTDPGRAIGVGCLGPADDPNADLGGYWFVVQPGGAYTLFVRPIPSGTVRLLEEGRDGRIDAVTRLSIRCVPVGFGGAVGRPSDVNVTGYANGLQIASHRDANGYSSYTYAGLTLLSRKEPGAEVRFTRVTAQVPGEDWTP